MKSTAKSFIFMGVKFPGKVEPLLVQGPGR